jgi:hypothetical protein
MEEVGNFQITAIAIFTIRSNFQTLKKYRDGRNNEEAIIFSSAQFFTK